MKHYAPFCQIIFLSSYLSYATEVYETEHIYFILKSQLHQRIGPALHQALTALGDRSVQITAQKDGSTHVIALQDVLYLERNLRKTKVITQQGVFLTQESPETLISGSGHFVRCHQSYWVNLKHVQAIGSNHLFSLLLYALAKRPQSRSDLLAGHRQSRPVFTLFMRPECAVPHTSGMVKLTFGQYNKKEKYEISDSEEAWA